MKKYIIAAAALLVVSVPAMAQARDGHRGDRNHSAQRGYSNSGGYGYNDGYSYNGGNYRQVRYNDSRRDYRY